MTVSAEEENASVEEQPGALDEHQDDRITPRLLWGITALVFLVAAVILLIRREHGYAGVTFAVAVSAAINLK